MNNPQRIPADELERQVISNISDFGWHVVNVVEDDGHPPWTYTIGFWETWNHPELIILGRSRATAHHILETIALRLDADDRPDLTQPTDTLIPGAACHFIEVAERYYQDYVGLRPLVLPQASLPAVSAYLAQQRRPIPLGHQRTEILQRMANHARPTSTGTLTTTCRRSFLTL